APQRHHDRQFPAAHHRPPRAVAHVAGAAGTLRRHAAGRRVSRLRKRDKDMRFPSIARLAIGLAMALAALTGASAQMAPANDQPVTITFYSYNLATAGIGA